MKVGGSEEEEEEEDVFLPFEVFLPRFRVRSRRRPTMVMLWCLGWSAKEATRPRARRRRIGRFMMFVCCVDDIWVSNLGGLFSDTSREG